MNLSTIISNNCIPDYTSSQSHILTEHQRLVWFFNRLRCIINIITERDTARGSDIVHDESITLHAPVQVWLLQEVSHQPW